MKLFLRNRWQIMGLKSHSSLFPLEPRKSPWGTRSAGVLPQDHTAKSPLLLQRQLCALPALKLPSPSHINPTTTFILENATLSLFQVSLLQWRWKEMKTWSGWTPVYSVVLSCHQLTLLQNSSTSLHQSVPCLFWTESQCPGVNDYIPKLGM